MTNRSHIFCLAGHSEQSSVRASAQAPARCTTHFTEEQLSHHLYTAHDLITPEPWTSLLWPYQKVKTQTLQFTTFLATMITALNLLQKGLLQSWQGLGVTKKSYNMLNDAGATIILTTQLNSSGKSRPVASSALNSPKKTQDRS